MPLRAMPARSRVSICCMRFIERLKPIARRSSSASPPQNPATTIAIRRSCSWNSGTPSVRSSTGSSADADRSPALAAPALEIGMHHVADDRAGADDRDLDDEVVEMLGPKPRQRRHLRAGFHLEQADVSACCSIR